MPQFEIRPNRFLMWWLVGGVLVYPLAIIVGAIAIFVIGAVVNAVTSFMRTPLYRLEYSIPAFSIIYGGVLIAVLGAAIGFSVGHIQRHLLRRYLFWTADYWRVLSTVGGLIGALIAGGILSLTPYNTSHNDTWLFLLMPIFMGGVSLFQWRSLRHATRHASVWIATNVIASVVWSGVIFMNQPDPYTRYYGLSMLLLGALAVTAQGFITGFMMLWMFEKFAYPTVDDDGKPATDAVTPGRKPSVWDNAI